jgi:hypothetical protein
VDPNKAFLEVYKALQQKGAALEFASAFWDDKMLVPCTAGWIWEVPPKF